MKGPKGVTTQMKALDEYFLLVVLTLLLNTVDVLPILFLVIRSSLVWK